VRILRALSPVFWKGNKILVLIRQPYYCPRNSGNTESLAEGAEEFVPDMSKRSSWPTLDALAMSFATVRIGTADGPRQG
jgi:hypothetical protein